MHKRTGEGGVALTLHRGNVNVGIIKGQIICTGVEMDAQTMEKSKVHVNSWTNTNLNLKGVGLICCSEFISHKM